MIRNGGNYERQSMALRRLLVATSNYSGSFIDEYGKGFKMKYILAYLGIISAFGFMVFIANQQLDEIRSLKAQLAISEDYVMDLENDVSTCKADISFLKGGVEDLISTCTPKK